MRFRCRSSSLSTSQPPTACPPARPSACLPACLPAASTSTPTRVQAALQHQRSGSFWGEEKKEKNITDFSIHLLPRNKSITASEEVSVTFFLKLYKGLWSSMFLISALFNLWPCFPFKSNFSWARSRLAWDGSVHRYSFKASIQIKILMSQYMQGFKCR